MTYIEASTDRTPNIENIELFINKLLLFFFLIVIFNQNEGLISVLVKRSVCIILGLGSSSPWLQRTRKAGNGAD